MKIGLIDVDGGKKFPNICLMKISAWHKLQGDYVEWAKPLDLFTQEHYDKIYASKVFSFSPDINDADYDADVIERGGTGYAIKLVDGREVYSKEKDKPLPQEIEHIYPDYSIYPQFTEDTAYGFLSRGCPRGCHFCHVASKEGQRAYKVAGIPSEIRAGSFAVYKPTQEYMKVKKVRETAIECTRANGTFVAATKDMFEPAD